MDLQRIFLFLIFSFSLMLVWDGWQRHEHPQQQIEQQLHEKSQVVPSALSQQSTHAATDKSSVNIEQQSAQQAGKIIKVKTDFLDAEINTLGGNITYLALLKQADPLDKNKPLVLFDRGKGTHNYFAESGLIGTGLPNHNSLYEAKQDHYEISGNQQQVEVRLEAQSDSKLRVTKIITFHKSSYVIDIAYEMDNLGKQPITASSYYQLIRDSVEPAGSLRFLPTYTGVEVYTSKNKLEKVKFTDIDKGKLEYPKQSDNGWIGILQHYFVSAWLPKEGTNREYFTHKLDDGLYSAGVVLPSVDIAPGQNARESSRLYAGPTEATLNKIAPGFGLTVDYGWLTVIAVPIFWVMSWFHSWIGNWGVSIILLTFLIKLIFFPLSAASYRSMAKMRLVAPKLEKIKKQYADDREQLNRAMMELYKTEKINPLGGCLPVVIQIPVFIALYWSILGSVEMRNAPFFGWITDLSSPDPYYILPLIMGASMMIQMRLNPKPADPMQAKVMQFMPIIFSAMFFFFPAGLVLYSIVNNVLSITQQWFITRRAVAESKGAAPKR